ncbi:hypothetical protein PENTCL1PPCAC_27594 [Pristionchus entomophagus]|uniref:Carbonic anhydrase n=1 Tax=Pristionchus entomophagus TaxID=358040 RepID=A0AAV5UEP3_9BILA|nr:hypothetical protein PENTCL1PPCAC_27594 [Pristionchus entomophagus]
MQRILRGVIQYRQTVRKELVEQFNQIKDNPQPKALMFTCMDSRMLPTRFTQAKVGDIFVVRNAGNMIPDACNYGHSSEVSCTTEPAALELAVKRGGVKHVIVCGHSDCKAMNMLFGLHSCPSAFDHSSPMDHWLRKNGHRTMKKLNERLYKGPQPLKFDSEIAPSQSFEAIIDPFDRLKAEDKLSQINVLQQLINISSHESLREAFEKGTLYIHGMWFDVYKGEDYLFSKEKRQFVIIKEDTLDGLMDELHRRCDVPLGQCPDIAEGHFTPG